MAGVAPKLVKASRFARAAAQLKLAWNTYPETCVAVTIACGSMVAGIVQYIREPYGGRIVRYKVRYTIMRPDDPRLDKYPTAFVTDSHLLNPKRHSPDPENDTPYPIKFW